MYLLATLSKWLSTRRYKLANSATTSVATNIETRACKLAGHVVDLVHLDYVS